MNYIYKCVRCKKTFHTRGVLSVECKHCRYRSSNHQMLESHFTLLEVMDAMSKFKKERGGDI